MTWKKIILPPVAIYAAIFLFISALIGFKVNQNATWVWLVTLIITIFGIYYATKITRPQNLTDGLILGVSWLVMTVILDMILTRPFTGWGFFVEWQTWLAYFVILILPIILPKK